MTNLEDLEKRKRELSLKADIERLERHEKLRTWFAKNGTTKNILTGLSALFGTFLVFASIADGVPLGFVIAAPFFIPAFMKIWLVSS